MNLMISESYFALLLTEKNEKIFNFSMFLLTIVFLIIKIF